ncbi:MAG TPA: SatD family protein [Plantibacter sp.]|uniref:SatD family protein n=1 Tax=unclassified Plantibacter TaxID=2624265 RepID=UPI002C24D52F|nr:SatD family protein [Plantibacter sp.]
MDQSIAMIVDISRSKEHADRIALQRMVEQTLDRAGRIVSPRQPFTATVGDEFQAVFDRLGPALLATLLVRLELPAGIECRFGLGFGEVRDIGTGPTGALQDGSGWWAARAAIERARAHEYAKLSEVRTWFVAADEALDAPHQGLVNAYLLGRDHLVGAMSDRGRRLLLGKLLGQSQKRLAQLEDVTESAVSQTVRAQGVLAVVEGEKLMRESLG